MKRAFPKCGGCGNIITEDDCGAQTDSEGYTYCCGWSPSEHDFREDNDDGVNYDVKGKVEYFDWITKERVTIWDDCYNDYVNEQVCDSQDHYYIDQHLCDNGCYNGECVTTRFL